jgi:hypothetical protein
VNSREIDREVNRLANERGWGDFAEDPRVGLAAELLTDREEARLSLLTRVRSLGQDLERLEGMLKNPDPILNTLGELQMRPSAVEAGVGQFAATCRAWNQFLKAYPPLEG